MFCLHSLMKKYWIKSCRASPSIGLMCDESTDISVTKELILYARVLCHGKMKARFLKLIHIPDGKAETVEKEILAYLHTANIPLSTITAFGSDGASVMVGSVNGVAARLKRRNPTILSVHCIN